MFGGKLVVALLVAPLVAGCTQVIDDAKPRMERPVAPIAAVQVDDLLSKNVLPDSDPDLFATVEPAECAAVAREVDAPFIFDAQPAAHAGGDWEDVEAGIVEVAGVYHSDFDPAAAVDRVERTIDSCRDDTLHVTASSGATLDPRVRPRSDSGTPQIVLWSLTETGVGACDNAFVAAHNAAIEITACAETNGYDVLAVAREALKRIEALANTTT